MLTCQLHVPWTQTRNQQLPHAPEAESQIQRARGPFALSAHRLKGNRLWAGHGGFGPTQTSHEPAMPLLGQVPG